MTTSMENDLPISVNSRRPRPARVGVVVSDKCDKTIAVLFRYSVKHKKYGKYIQRRTKLHAQDDHNQARVGDLVELGQCRRMSKMKCWRLLRIIKAAPQLTTGSVKAAPVVNATPSTEVQP